MTSMTDSAVVVRQERTIPASRHRVYRAWLDPEVLLRWFGAAPNTPTKIEVDERVGGRLATYQVGADGEDAGGIECRLLELVPDERIVLLWRFCGPDRNPDPSHDSRVTVTLTPSPDGSATELSLVHERLEAIAAAHPEMADAVDAGWRKALDKLVAAFAEAS
jgi:uncharacterized protein YndB with AHSA1/START domain